MKNLAILILSLYSFVTFFQCKNDKQAGNAVTSKPLTIPAKSDTSADPLMIQIPPDYYRPAGLRQLNIMEMYKFGKAEPLQVRALPLKDKDGKPISYHVLESIEKPMFMQMYANDSGRVVEGVVFEMNDDIKGLIMKVRMVSQ